MAFEAVGEAVVGGWVEIRVFDQKKAHFDPIVRFGEMQFGSARDTLVRRKGVFATEITESTEAKNEELLYTNSLQMKCCVPCSVISVFSEPNEPKLCKFL